MSSGSELDLALDPRLAGAERVESPATQLQAGELASLNYGGDSSWPVPQVVLWLVQAAALSTPAQAAPFGKGTGWNTHESIPGNS
jgi:hypothetical protein